MKIALYKNLNDLTISEGTWEVNIKDEYLDELLFQITQEYTLDELYINDELDDWALKNGYVKEKP